MFIFIFPKLAKLFPNWSGYYYILSTIQPLKKLFKDTIKEHEQTLQDGHPRDYIDAFLQEVKNTDNPNSSFHKSKSGLFLKHILILFLFMAGRNFVFFNCYSILITILWLQVAKCMQNDWGILGAAEDVLTEGHDGEIRLKYYKLQI